MGDEQHFTNQLQASKVLIIGGSSGIGLAVARAVLENGAEAIISSSNASKLRSAVEALQRSYPSASSRISGYTCDIGDAETVESNIRTLFSQIQKVDHVVVTAGDALSMIPVHDLTVDTIRQAGQTRFVAPLLIAKHASNHLTDGPRSSITFTGGVVAERPVPGWTVIAAYAAGMQGLVRGLALDLKPVRVNVVQPGFVDTGLYATSGIPDQMKQGIFADARQKLPVGQVGTPEILAEAYLYLMKDVNATGAILDSSGGQLIV